MYDISRNVPKILHERAIYNHSSISHCNTIPHVYLVLVTTCYYQSRNHPLIMIYDSSFRYSFQMLIIPITKADQQRENGQVKGMAIAKRAVEGTPLKILREQWR